MQRVAAIRGASTRLSHPGIGSISWHAALNASTHFYANAHPVYVQDAAELLNYATISHGPPGLAGSAASSSSPAADAVLRSCN